MYILCCLRNTSRTIFVPNDDDKLRKKCWVIVNWSLFAYLFHFANNRKDFNAFNYLIRKTSFSATPPSTSFLWISIGIWNLQTRFFWNSSHTMAQFELFIKDFCQFDSKELELVWYLVDWHNYDWLSVLSIYRLNVSMFQCHEFPNIPVYDFVRNSYSQSKFMITFLTNRRAIF